MTDSPISSKKSRSRQTPTAAILSLEQYRNALAAGNSQRAAAVIADVPRTTLQHRAKPRELPFHQNVSDFLQTPEGAEFLNFIILSVAMGFVVCSGVGLPAFIRWLKECKLDSFVASSYGTWRTIVSKMESTAQVIAEEENKKHAKNVSGKEVTIGLDETWLKKMCLVCAEMPSGFILFESYQEKRDRDTWKKVWDEEVAPYSLKPIQVVADAGTGIRGFIEGTLRTYRSPDLFHIEHDLCKALARFLATKEQSAKENITERQEIYQNLKQRELEYLEGHNQKKAREAKRDQAQIRGFIAAAHRHLQSLRRERDRFRNLLARLSKTYQPITQEGQRKSASILENELRDIFSAIYRLAKRVDLPINLRHFIEKAERQIAPMVDTLKAFSLRAEQMVSRWTSDHVTEYSIHSYLIPAMLLKRQAKLLSGQERIEAENQSVKLGTLFLDKVKSSTDVVEAEKLAAAIAASWQRSSSAIEGRNGILSQRHHGLRGISENKLRTLTALHNYFSKRNDGTTAAERFFCASHVNIFRETISRCGQIPLAYRRAKSMVAA